MGSPDRVGQLTASFLTDGGQDPKEVAEKLGRFVSEAERTLDVAIYDFHARDGAGSSVADALESARSRGVNVRVAFNTERIAEPGQHPPMECDPSVIDGLDVPTRAVHDQGALMHHKYIVRDGASVWTGSTNWTDDAFGREENVIVTVDSVDLATAFSVNFDRLWDKGRLDRTGGSGPEETLDHGVRVRPYFSPHPPSLGHLIATMVAEADRRVRICSPVVTSGAVLGTLAELASRAHLDFSGAYDWTQMDEVQRQWQRVPSNHWKIEAWKVIAPRLSGKHSTPYSPTAVHDYMHAKFVVADDEVVAGSYNLSRHGEGNAENVLHIVSEFQARLFAEFADQVAARYLK
jgi:phosphatidylserine/phosphatidylglycerophosphate/cardiolipin synthase-like enzyme